VTLATSRKWAIGGLLGLGIVIAYLDRANISVALATSEFTDFYRLPDSDRGTLNSAFFWSCALLQIPTGWVDRFRVRIP
jgi:MFS transporter, ACS family, D-galactonate transporter